MERIINLDNPQSTNLGMANDGNYDSSSPKTTEIENTPIKFGRRSFMIMTGATVALLATGCQENTPNINVGKKRLIEELGKLPNSPIKDLLLTRVRPLYGANPPTSLNYDGLNIKVVSPEVVLKNENIKQVSGLFTFRDSTGIVPEPLYPMEDRSMMVPYIGLILDTEKSIVPESNLGSDGTPLLIVNFSTKIPFYEGIRPVITITTSDVSVIKTEYKKWYKNMERWAYIKEACTALLMDMYTEEVVKKMHQLGLNTNLTARTANGTVKQAEAIIQALNLINNNQGRINAAIDLAGYLLAFKATEGTEIDDKTNVDKNWTQARPYMQAAKLGNSPPEILYNSLRWAINTPEADKLLIHVGNINKIP